MFSATIRQNIDFADTGSDMDKVVEYAKIAQVYDNIMDFPNQFETMVGERGHLIRRAEAAHCHRQGLIKEPRF